MDIGAEHVIDYLAFKEKEAMDDYFYERTYE